MFFHDLDDLLRILVVGVLAYVSLLLLLRASGKRTLTQMNAFGLIVTVALGSTLATVLLSSDVSLSEGILALALLIALQFAVAFMAVQAPWSQRFIKSEPTLLLYKGQFLEKAVRAERLSESEVLASIRGSGLASTEQVLAAVLETNGSVSVTPMDSATSLENALEAVQGYPS